MEASHAAFCRATPGAAPLFLAQRRQTWSILQSVAQPPHDVASLLARRIDPVLIEASKEVDRSLLQWSLNLTPLQRLEACTRATRALSRFKRVSVPESR